jgi:hypothetical protein
LAADDCLLVVLTSVGLHHTQPNDEQEHRSGTLARSSKIRGRQPQLPAADGVRPVCGLRPVESVEAIRDVADAVYGELRRGDRRQRITGSHIRARSPRGS